MSRVEVDVPDRLFPESPHRKGAEGNSEPASISHSACTDFTFCFGVIEIVRSRHESIGCACEYNTHYGPDGTTLLSV